VKNNRIYSKILISIILAFLLGAGIGAAKEGGEIVHDGEYNFLVAQYGEQWAKEDKEIDANLQKLSYF
jgi:arylsulfatase